MPEHPRFAFLRLDIEAAQPVNQLACYFT